MKYFFLTCIFPSWDISHLDKTRFVQTLQPLRSVLPTLPSLVCSMPCKHVTWNHPSILQQHARHCALHSNQCHCCKVSLCALCGPHGSKAAPPCFPRTAKPMGTLREKQAIISFAIKKKIIVIFGQVHQTCRVFLDSHTASIYQFTILIPMN